MARIRIVDEWVRSPASPPTHYRTVMVVAEKWAEQRVLMRAYAECRDQIRPTIVLHGVELAIGPAGIDAHGPWGIHVMPPSDGRAQELADQLDGAARRLAGSKGNPPRLADEESAFDRKPTHNWSPGTPRDLAEPLAPTMVPGGRDWPPTNAPYQPPVAHLPAAASAVPVRAAAAELVGSGPAMPPVVASAPANPSLRRTPLPMRHEPRARKPTGPMAPTGAGSGALSGARTALGYQSGAGAQSAVVRLGLSPAVSARLGRLVGQVVPADFQVTHAERSVLNAIGEQTQLTARAIGQMVGVTDPVGWMEQLISKLESFGIELIEPGDARGGEPTYVMRR
ncbi:MAG: hypothetical protein KBG28_08425 [Kofleriaceae bacterium]|jgi:hypothetical protein|nr:hypothetical protein [Kofleriaceae bacterium]MBP6838315.1 hypothetical protein [Kofleriaceae bacterium]MBP9203971.1 hypothetical protein [Kofleriaceae bacterium]